MGDLRNSLVEAALAEGFVLAETIDLAPVLDDPERRFHRQVQAYDDWLAGGAHGEMAYLARGRERRADPRVVMPEAKSLLCVAIPYAASSAGETDPTLGVRYARYLQGPDYHDDIKGRLERTLARVQQNFPALKGKPCVDTSAVLERAWCSLAGLGWIGKNTMMIHPKWGSYLFLGVLMVNEETGRGPTLHADYCGKCTRCLKSCPTEALTRPRFLDSRKCISYLTLEKRGPRTEEERGKTQNWVAGCDLCQEACPFNTKPSKDPHRTSTTATATTRLAHWRDLLQEGEPAYRERIRHSSLARIKWPEFQRNLAESLTEQVRAGAVHLDDDLRALIVEKENSATAEWLRNAWSATISATESP